MNAAEFERTFKLPFVEAAQWFRDKLNIPTSHWAELEGAAHAKAFTSAGAVHADLLNDLRTMTDKAIAGGMDIREFRKEFRPLVGKYGWQLKGGGPGWRSDLIWRTNIQTAYQAGRWQQFEEAGITHLKYVHNDSVRHPRPHHVAMDGTVLPRTDPFWAVNYPPNGFGCKCRAVPATKAEIASAGDTPKRPANWENLADANWNHNVGKSSWQPDFAKYPADVKQALLAGLAAASERAGVYPQLIKTLSKADLTDMETAMWMRDAQDTAFASWVDEVLEDKKPRGKLYPVGNLPWSVIRGLEQRLGQRLRMALVILDDTQLLHMTRPQKQGKLNPSKADATLTVDEIKSIPERLTSGDWYWDSEKENSLLVWVRLGAKWLKTVIELNYKIGGRRELVANHIVTTGVVERENITENTQYEKL